MTEAIADPEGAKLAYIVDLAMRLSDRILDAQISGRQIEPEQLGALTQAASLLQELSVPWPPLMKQVLHEFAARLDDQITPELPQPEVDSVGVVAGLSRFLGAFRRDKNLPAEA